MLQHGNALAVVVEVAVVGGSMKGAAATGCAEARGQKDFSVAVA